MIHYNSRLLYIIYVKVHLTEKHEQVCITNIWNAIDVNY